MTSNDIVERLAALPLCKDVARAELEWLVSRGGVRRFPTGGMIGQEGEAIDWMAILLEGRVGLYLTTGGGRRKLLEAVAGHVLGVLPYSRFQKSPGTSVVEEPIVLLALHRDEFPALIRECPTLTTALVHHMLDRTRDYRSAQMTEERLQSLSRLASGLAHELNNPASAAARSARSLSARLDDAERAARELAAARLTDEQLEVIDAVRTSCSGPTQMRTALEAADREDDIAEWLTRHGLEPLAAEALAASDVTVAGLDRLAASVPANVLGAATRWVASGCAARAVSKQIETSTTRIHDLVAAIKGFSFMDREGVPEDVDVARGLADTLAMLESKLRATAVDVHIETAADLPRVHGYGSELNQVWEKLVDNAIDAAGQDGQVTVTAAGRGDSVIVRVSDNGRGIPDDIRSRIFDPFFTTKPVGQGSGLGLYLARRVVHLHGGDLEFSSQPGRTVFRVRLPIARAGGSGEAAARVS